MRRVAVCRSMKTKTLFKWKRHPDAKSLIRAFFSGMGAGDQANQIQVVMSDNTQHTTDEFVQTITKLGSWGFTQTFKGKRKRKPEIHFWAEPEVPVHEVAFLLGHEVGHNLGTKKKGLREECRADEYGRAAEEVVRQLMQRRML